MSVSVSVSVCSFLQGEMLGAGVPFRLLGMSPQGSLYSLHQRRRLCRPDRPLRPPDFGGRRLTSCRGQWARLRDLGLELLQRVRGRVIGKPRPLVLEPRELHGADGAGGRVFQGGDLLAMFKCLWLMHVFQSLCSEHTGQQTGIIKAVQFGNSHLTTWTALQQLTGFRGSAQGRPHPSFIHIVVQPSTPPSSPNGNSVCMKPAPHPWHHHLLPASASLTPLGTSCEGHRGGSVPL